MIDINNYWSNQQYTTHLPEATRPNHQPLDTFAMPLHLKKLNYALKLNPCYTINLNSPTLLTIQSVKTFVSETSP